MSCEPYFLASSSVGVIAALTERAAVVSADVAISVARSPLMNLVDFFIVDCPPFLFTHYLSNIIINQMREIYKPFLEK